MGLLFCYSVFGRRTKMGKAVSNLGSKTGLRAIRKADLESRDSAAGDLALLKGMDEFKVVDAMLKGDEGPQDAVPEYGIECALLDSFSKEQLGFEGVVASPEKLDVPEFVVDVEKLSSHQDSHQPPYDDHGKSCYEIPMSSCSQGTFQGEVSLSVGEGTMSSDGQRPAVPHQDALLIGGSLGANEDGSSASSFDGCSNMSSHARGCHDRDSAGCAGLSHEFAFGTRYSDDGAPQVVVDPKSEGVAQVEGCLDTTHVLNAPICDDEERYSGHASDPGFYAREVQKPSPDARLDGSMSPHMGANESPSLHLTSVEKLSVEVDDEMVGSMPQAPNLSQGIATDELNPSFSRVKEWINSIQSFELDFGVENEDLNDSGRANFSVDMPRIESSEALTMLHMMDSASANSLVNASVRSLHPSSTVAHLSGIGLREVPSLALFNSLRSLNLSANLIVHVPVGCLPRSLHSLDLSRNRIAQIQGFREMTRLRVLNLSYNRIARIGHGLANCTLIKELYLAGNKIGEVEGLHRLLKLAVLDLSFNKVTTSKAIGQLAANYGSLLALNLLGNPVLTNFSEDQMRKLVTALTPHVTYLNKQPIKAVSVREAASDSVARAALGTSQRHKTRDIKAVRKPSGALPSAVKKKPPPHQHTRLLEKKVTSASSSGHHHHHHHHHHHGKVSGRTHSPLLGESQNMALVAIGKQPMPRSRSAGVLQE